MVEYNNASVIEAANQVIHEKLEDIDGTGGVNAIDNEGNFASPYSTAKMIYGYLTEDGEYHIVLSESDEKEGDNQPSTSTYDIISQVKDLANEDELDDDEVVDSLTSHLSAVSQYESEKGRQSSKAYEEF